MRNLLLLVCGLTLLGVSYSTAQNVIGAWEGISENSEGQKIRNIVIFGDGYQTISKYLVETGEFVSTNGGTWHLDGNMMSERVEFDSANPTRVGSVVTFEIEQTYSTLKIVGGDIVLNRIDNGAPGVLRGAWLITGRKRDGQMNAIDTTRTRKTMKILSGTRFQWIAFDIGTKEFKGTGGGEYTTKDGIYTESIEFFSRDDSRVGAELSFDYHLKDGHWHHNGFSSKGNPIYEVWSVRL